MNRYKNLITNTIVFGIGTFSSKLLVFFLVPLYTSVLSKEQMGISDMIVNVANLLYPIATVSITSAMLRFGMDKHYKKADVFSSGIVATACSFLVFLALYPVVNNVKSMEGYGYLVYIYMFTGVLRGLCSQFVRAKEYIRLYTIDGVLATTTTIVFNIMFLVVFKLGVVGYVLATICSDLCSSIFLFLRGRLFRYVKFKAIRRSTVMAMLRYSLPLIPSFVSWWMTNTADRYVVNYYDGAAMNGLFAMSYKLPTVISVLSTIFIEAWQMSAIKEGESKDRGAFFTRVFSVYSSFLFAAGSGLIMLAQPIIRLWMDEKFYEAWRYIPFLIIATIFSSFVTFMGSIYMVEKKNIMSLVTAVLGAVLNVGLNFWWVPIYGPNGAAFASFLCFILVFLMRVVNTKKYINMKFSTMRMVVNVAILLAQSFVLINSDNMKGTGAIPTFWIYEIAMTVVMCVINGIPILLNAKKIFSFRNKEPARELHK